jgi:hypothetical protein
MDALSCLLELLALLAELLSELLNFGRRTVQKVINTIGVVTTKNNLKTHRGEQVQSRFEN